MIVDASHKSWIYGSLTGAFALAVAYGILRAAWLGRWGGGTPFGLICGVVGATVIVFDCLLGVRKKYPTLRVGRTHHWLKAHVWFGLLSFFAVVLHSGFSLGGALTTALMILFAAITVSGIAGMVLQQFLPRVMMAELPEEAIFEQMPEVLGNLQEQADQIVRKLGAQIEPDPPAAAEPPPPNAQSDAQRTLGDVYRQHVRPYLRDEGRSELLSSARKTRLLFEHLRLRFPPAAHGPLSELERLAVRRRELAMQQKLHYLLHGWLLAHAPLSAALLILMFLHAFVAFLLT